MNELLDPRKLRHHFLGEGWHYKLDYTWLEERVKEHGGKLLFDVGCGNSIFGRYLSWVYGLQVVSIDRGGATYSGDFETLKFNETPDIVMWASSLEHNNIEKMARLYQKSLDILSTGGLFLATIPVSLQTDWFPLAGQVNLNLQDASAMFGEISGNYDEVWKAYRDDNDLVVKYSRRFAHFRDDSPAYIAAGITKVK